MPMGDTVTILESSERLAIPARIRRQARLKVGDVVLLQAKPGVITISTKPRAIAQEDSPHQRTAIKARLAIAEEDVRAGRTYGPFDSAAEAVASMQAELRKRSSARKRVRAR